MAPAVLLDPRLVSIRKVTDIAGVDPSRIDKGLYRAASLTKGR
jgi:hypothetical protein